MKNITMIAAVGKNLELGKNNDLIWHFKEDMKFFKEQTMGKPVVMGYKTLESLPKLLPGRKHIVLTRRNLELDPAILVVHSVEELLEKVRDIPEVMIIGGATVYQEMLAYSDKLILTEIDAESDADVYFPSFNKKEWDSQVIGECEENSISYKHLVYTRKKVRKS
ncbi:MAG: dihydrofolate reductase [Bacilli bacterium]|nr:dihydrofolate reductase [Bacilli bacterium]